jgi:hypothetical protein
MDIGKCVNRDQKLFYPPENIKEYLVDYVL